MVRVLVMILLFIGVVSASKAKEATAEKLLITMKTAETLESTIDQMLDVQLQSQPMLVPYRAVLRLFIYKYFGYESIKKDLVKLYAELYTEEELLELISFYETPTGVKSITLIPELFQKATMIATEQLQNNSGELEKMLMDAMASGEK